MYAYDCILAQAWLFFSFSSFFPFDRFIGDEGRAAHWLLYATNATCEKLSIKPVLGEAQ